MQVAGKSKRPMRPHLPSLRVQGLAGCCEAGARWVGQPPAACQVAGADLRKAGPASDVSACDIYFHGLMLMGHCYVS